MRKLIIPVILAVFMIGVLFGLFGRARSQAASPGGPVVLKSETQGDSTREITAPEGYDASAQSPDAPNIGFIDSPTATCYQPDPQVDECFLNWYYMSVNASPNYIIAMTVTLNAIGPVARFNGFFQTSMYAPYNMLDRGFKVACGSLGAGGQATLGNAYAWTINARDSANLTAANYGTSYCPAYAP